MHAVVLAATHETKFDSAGREVPLPLVDLHREREPYLTTLADRLAGVPGLAGLVVVTNEAIRPQLDAWAAALRPFPFTVRVLSDGTRTPDERLGAVGDLMYAVTHAAISDDLLVIGGDNWFKYDLADFVERSRERSPAVVVTPFRPAWGAGRFGVVDLAADGWVARFLEKPASTELTLKASCVYYFAAADLPLFDAFAAARAAAGESTRCTPGTFLAWLVETGRPLYAVEADGGWRDVADAAPAGPDTLAFASLLRRAVHQSQSTWGRPVARWMALGVNSFDTLLDILNDADPNRRILAAQLLGEAGELLDAGARERVTAGLERLLADEAQNDYESWQGDEDTAVYVSATAAEALTRLGYAESAAAVFARARAAGRPVAERANRYW